MEGKEPGVGQWTSTQAYVLSVICLLVGWRLGISCGALPRRTMLRRRFAPGEWRKRRQVLRR